MLSRPYVRCKPPRHGFARGGQRTPDSSKYVDKTRRQGLELSGDAIVGAFALMARYSLTTPSEVT